MVLGDWMMLVPMRFRGLVQLLMAIAVRIITNSGTMATVAEIASLTMTTTLKHVSVHAAVVCALFSSLIRKLVKTAEGCIFLRKWE